MATVVMTRRPSFAGGIRSLFLCTFPRKAEVNLCNVCSTLWPPDVCVCSYMYICVYFVFGFTGTGSHRPTQIDSPTDCCRIIIAGFLWNLSHNSKADCSIALFYIISI